MDTLDGISFTEGSPRVVAEGPSGERVILLEGIQEGGTTGRIDATFAAYVDLASVDPRAFDLLKIEVRASRAATLLLAINNYPEPGLQARWHVLDGLRGPFEWRTIVVDLRLPEEIREADDGAGVTRRLMLRGSVKDTGRSLQGERRQIHLGHLRAVRKQVDLDWDQVSFSYTHRGDLVYTYPVTVRNVESTATRAALRVVPFQAAFATASVTPEAVALPPGGEATAEVRITLPGADRFEPLYAERFEAWADVPGADDASVTILRSSDPIHLPVVVPLPDDRLRFPLFPTPDALPARLLQFDEGAAHAHATTYAADELIAHAAEHGIYNYHSRSDDERFRRALVSAAYLYRLTNEDSYLTIARALLNALPEIWAAQLERYEREVRHPLVSSGVIVRMRSGWHYTLGLGWRLSGTQRSPYFYGRSGNGAGGSMSGIFYAFDMVAADLSEDERHAFVYDFALPAGIRARNHYVGDGNQQSTANSVALYAGLAARNWPLVAFATSSEHGLASVLEWTHTDEGMHIRGGYQTYALRPVFHMMELLYHRGVDLYEPYRDRLQAAVEWRGARAFQDRYFWNFVQQNRLRAVRPLASPEALEVLDRGRHITLRWRDTAPNESGFVVERATENGGFEEVGRTPLNWSAFEESCPEGSASYRYRVRAINYAAGNSGPSNVATVACP